MQDFRRIPFAKKPRLSNRQKPNRQSKFCLLVSTQSPASGYKEAGRFSGRKTAGRAAAGALVGAAFGGPAAGAATGLIG